MTDPRNPFGIYDSDEEDSIPQPGESMEDFRRRKMMASLYTGSPSPAMNPTRAAAVVDPETEITEQMVREYNPMRDMSESQRDLLSGAPGSAYSRYMDWAKNNPPPMSDQFKPKLSQKILAAIAGFKFGAQGRGDLAIKTGQDIMNAGYNQAMDKYIEQDKALSRSAAMEERERSISRRQANAEARQDLTSWKAKAGAFEKKVKASAGPQGLEAKWKARQDAAKIEAANNKDEFARNEKLKADQRADATARRLAESADLANKLKQRELDTESEPTVLSPTAEREGIQNILPGEVANNPGWDLHFQYDDNGTPIGPAQITPEKMNKKAQAMLQKLGKTPEQYNRDAVWLWNEMRKKAQGTYSRTPGRRVRRIQ